MIGTLYGAGDGSTTFNLPDLQGRVAAGWAASGGHADVSTLGLTDGTSTLADRRPRHKHTVANPAISISDPGHHHTYTQIIGGSGGGLINSYGQASAANTSTATTGITATASGTTVGPQTGAEPVDAPSYLVVNHIIKT